MLGLPGVLADCSPAAGSEQLFGIAIPALFVLAWLFFVVRVVARAPAEDRPALLGTLAGSIAIGALAVGFALRPGNGEFLGIVLIGAIAAVALAGVFARYRRELTGKLLNIAVLGAIGPFIALIAWVFIGLFTGQFCFD